MERSSEFGPALNAVREGAARLLKFQRGDAAKLPVSTASKRLEKCLIDAGIDAFYSPFNGKMQFCGDDKTQVENLPGYAWKGADCDAQDSKLIAESLRFTTNNGYGMNRLADAITAEFGGVR